jgi:hypothetical protein
MRIVIEFICSTNTNLLSWDVKHVWHALKARNQNAKAIRTEIYVV